MKLDDRLKRIARGTGVVEAIDAYVAELSRRGEDVGDPEQAKRDELLAIVEIMFLMAAVDGEISAEEADQLYASIQALTDMDAVEGIEPETVLDDLGARLAREGWKNRLDEAASRLRTPDAKAFAFRLAAGVAFVDDFVAHAEAAAFDSLALALGFTREEAQSLLRDVHQTLFSRERSA